MTVEGDIGAIFDALKKALTEVKFSEFSSIWPTNMELTRGKGGLFAKKVQDCKTVLKVSLKQASDNVDVTLEYNFNVPASYLDKDNKELQEEFLKIKHLVADAPTSVTDKGLVCDVCLTPIRQGEKFCRNCGRSASRQKVKAQDSLPESKLDVSFDPTKVAFGQKVVDDCLYGGIPNNSAVVLTSPACEEKDLIVTRFIETGLDQQEIVVYVSTDNAMVKNLKNVQSLYHVICSAQADLMVSDQGSKNVVKIKGVDRLTELSVALTSLLNSIMAENDGKPRRLVLNILSDMLLSSQSVNTRKWIGETITKFKVKNFTILAMLNPHMHSKEETHALLDLFDGQVDLYEKETNAETKVCMRVKRMNNSRYSSKETELIREDLWIRR